MYMSYDSNPRLPRIRREAVRLVRSGESTRAVARHFGFSQSVIVKWVHRAPLGPAAMIPTRSSRPLHHPRELPQAIVWRILALREERNQCAEILHHRLSSEGISVSPSSVKRVLRRYGCSRYSRWKKWHQYPPRPIPEKPGILVEIDTIHDGPHERRLYLYTLLDVCSRFAYAEASLNISTHRSLRFIRNSRASLPFPIATLQSDLRSRTGIFQVFHETDRGQRYRSPAFPGEATERQRPFGAV